MIEKIIKKIRSLPPLPESVQRVREVCSNPEGTVKDLIPVIKQDPMFTADILKAANSPLYGFSKQIASIDQAVSLFGMGTIQGFAIAYAMRKSFSVDLSVYGINSNDLTNVSTMQNALICNWGKFQVFTYKDEMTTLSLIMELGKMIAAKIIEENNKTEIFKDEMSKVRTYKEILGVEKEFLSISSEQINAMMFKHWKFSETMIEIMQHIVEPEKADEDVKKHTQILRVAKEAIPVTSPLCEKSIGLALEKCKEYKLDYQSLNSEIKALKSLIAS
ncbi:HDOD domain-containing protein [Hydrogenimonas thermophila]|uniref:HD-like signal output (HDOD) domain, no enzymatic activity n=1 Tax=Hydrogenimonas thermophila TaxID=223786 RepID=A0A1I5L693_9BACT|nr:HDOD domain-containing protein [Hydrogenimonas thermophila]SFO92777.1 HD-like signal output (HDOD) domain, no enzymatic activity [Hydrogenimonas thermophila]